MPKIKTIFKPEFLLAWIVFLAALGAFVFDVFFLPWAAAFLEGGLLVVMVALVFAVSYRKGVESRIVAQPVDAGGLTRVLGELTDPVMMYDADFRVFFFNKAAEQLFRLGAPSVTGHVLSPKDVATPGWQVLIQTVFPSLASSVIARSPAGESPQIFDLSFADPALELRVTTIQVLDGATGQKSFLKIIRDQTTEIAALRSKSEFLTVASHQFRGPATDISWALQSLGSDATLSDANKAIVQNALEASQGLIRRIEDLLNIAKMEEGHAGYAFEEADIAEFVGKVLADLLPAARKAGVKLYFDRPAVALPHVTIDPRQMAIVLANLVENAVRYNVENGTVTVRIDPVDGKPFVRVSVKDTGIGIPPEAIDKLFKKFFRADNAVKSQTEGSGLGLYIAKSIVSAHGGEIGAESELGRGTTIWFTLPTDPNLVPKHETGAEGFLG